MAAYNKINCFVSDIVHGIHVLSTSSTLKLMLISTTVVPTASTLYTISDIGTGQLPTSNGYSTGGSSATITGSTQTSGTFKLLVSTAVTWTASSANSTAGIGPFQYVLAYEPTASNNVIAWFDYGSAVTLNPGETFTVGFDPSSGFFQLV